MDPITEPTFWFYIVSFFNYVQSLNLWAVLVAAVAVMFIGSLWYGPVFGKFWMKLMGIDKKKMSKMMKGGIPMWLSYLLAFIGSLFTALALALMIDGLGASTMIQSLVVTFILWIGLVMPITLGASLWEGKSFKLFFFNSAYNLLSMFVVAAIIFAWPQL